MTYNKRYYAGIKSDHNILSEENNYVYYSLAYALYPGLCNVRKNAISSYTELNNNYL